MLVRVDPDEPTGLADQIAAQIRGALAAGDVSAGERLPPARELANGLQVNMNTVLRAYRTLRDEGLIELRRGRGARVSSDTHPEQVNLRQHIDAVVATAQRAGLGRGELLREIESATKIAGMRK